MMKTTKALLTAATVLVLLGLVLFAGAMAKNHWNLTKLGTKELETNSYPVTESFRDVRIETHTADVRFVPSEDGSCRVVCRETENEKHSVTVQNGVLQVRVKDSREKNWFFFTGFSTETPSITLYLPEKEYGALHIQENTGDVEVPADFRFASLDVTSDTGDVTVGASTPAEIRIQTSTGDIRLENLSAKALELSTSTGKVSVRSVTCSGDLRIRVSTGDAELSDLACAGLISEGSTGEIVLRNVIAAEKISIERSTGDVRFENCDAAELSIETDTGDVTGSLRSEKIFIVHSDTGDVDVPRTASGGVCEIETDTGDVKITLS